MPASLKHIGIVGSGRLGTALARVLQRAGYEVAIINSKDGASLRLQLKIMLPGVEAREVDDLMRWADVIVLAVPLTRYQELPLDVIKDKIVIDAMNYWAPVDGKLAEFDHYSLSSSEIVARAIPGAKLVKTFNSVAYGELDSQTLAGDSLSRRAMPLAGDDEEAKAIVAALVDAIGFEPVDLGGLDMGVLFEPDTPLFNQRLTRDAVNRLVSKN